MVSLRIKEVVLGRGEVETLSIGMSCPVECTEEGVTGGTIEEEDEIDVGITTTGFDSIDSSSSSISLLSRFSSLIDGTWSLVSTCCDSSADSSGSSCSSSIGMTCSSTANTFKKRVSKKHKREGVSYLLHSQVLPVVMTHHNY